MIKVFNVDEEGRFGGPERRISLVAAYAQSLDVHTTVVIPKLDSVYFNSYLNERKIKHIVLDITRLSLELKILYRYIVRFPIEIILLFRIFTKHKPHIVHVNGASQFKVAIAAKLAHRHIIWHLNNTYLKRPVKLVFDILSKFCIDGIIYAGSLAGSFYNVRERFCRIPCENIEAPVSNEFFSIPIKDTIGDCLEIVCVGGVNPAKGITDVVLCASECSRRGLSFRIRVAGKLLGSQKGYFDEVQQLIAHHKIPPEVLEFLGEVENVPGLLSEADIALTLSHREASPVAVWEGLASGRIVVTTDVGSVCDHVEHGKNGFVVAPRDIDAVVEIIESIARNEIDLSGVRLAARAAAERCFTVQTIAGQHKTIYSQVLGYQSSWRGFDDTKS